MRSNRCVSLNRPMLSLEAHLGVPASPQPPFPTDFVPLPVSASHRRFGSLPLAAEEGHAPVLQHQLHRVLHSKHAQATSPPCGRATLAGRTVREVRHPTRIVPFRLELPADVVKRTGCPPIAHSGPNLLAPSNAFPPHALQEPLHRTPRDAN